MMISMSTIGSEYTSGPLDSRHGWVIKTLSYELSLHFVGICHMHSQKTFSGRIRCGCVGRIYPQWRARLSHCLKQTMVTKRRPSPYKPMMHIAHPPSLADPELQKRGPNLCLNFWRPVFRRFPKKCLHFPPKIPSISQNFLMTFFVF